MASARLWLRAGVYDGCASSRMAEPSSVACFNAYVPAGEYAVAATLGSHPEVLEAWSVTGEADAIARVRTRDNTDLERLIRELQRDGNVVRTRSQVVLSRLVELQ